MILQVGQPGWSRQNAFHFDRIVGVKVDAIEAAVGTAGLILGAHRLLE